MTATFFMPRSFRVFSGATVNAPAAAWNRWESGSFFCAGPHEFELTYGMPAWLQDRQHGVGRDVDAGVDEDTFWSTNLLAQLIEPSGVASLRHVSTLICAPLTPPALLMASMATSPPTRNSGSEKVPPSLLT